MKHTVTFFPVGNGDTSLIELDNGKWLLMDYFHQDQGEDPTNPIIDLKQTLTNKLNAARKAAFDVVMFTHADNDHIRGASDFFFFEHAAKYQGNERPKIEELWVPAAFVLEEGLEDHDRVIRQEARHRIRKGKGIKVFSKPEALKQWLSNNGLSVEDRRACFVDAGQIVPNFLPSIDGFELFCHAPFKEQIDDEEEYRNNASIILHGSFVFPTASFGYFIIGDADFDYLEKVVTRSEENENENRLAWDLYFIPHHCSYKGLSGDKGETETTPTDPIARLLKKGRPQNYMVVSCLAFETLEKPEDRSLPPHIQAKRCYERYSGATKGRKLFVTMAYPTHKDPKPLVIEITENGLAVKDPTPTPILTSSPPRAGSNDN